MRPLSLTSIAAAALALAAGLSPVARAEKPAPRSAPVDPALLDAATTFEQRIADNLYEGQVVTAKYADASRTGGVTGITDFGDSALWTGVYLAGESARYALDRHLAEHGTGQDKQWARDDLDLARSRVTQTAAALHRLITIAAGWDGGPPDPQGSPPSVGGAVAHGEAGLPFRFCASTDGWFHFGYEGYVYGPFGWSDGKQYYCRGDISRDGYAGLLFGELAAFDQVGPDDPALRAQLRDDVLAMASYLVRHAWTTSSPDGRVDPVGNQLVNVVNPLFSEDPSGQLHVTEAALHVATEAGTAQDQLTWRAVWNAELGAEGASLPVETLSDVATVHSGYYKFNLGHMLRYDLVRLAPDVASAELFRRDFGIVDATTGRSGNAQFQTLLYGVTGEPARAQDAAGRLRDWIDYRARVDAGTGVRNSTRCGADLECVPDIETDVHQTTPAGDVSVPVTLNTDCCDFPPDPSSFTSSSGLRAALPLPVALRDSTDYIWQRDPTKLDGGDKAREQYAGVDFLQPYWMLRYFSEVVRPALAPLPTWAGPSAG